MIQMILSVIIGNFLYTYITSYTMRKIAEISIKNFINKKMNIKKDNEIEW